MLLPQGPLADVVSQKRNNTLRWSKVALERAPRGGDLTAPVKRDGMTRGEAGMINPPSHVEELAAEEVGPTRERRGGANGGLAHTTYQASLLTVGRCLLRDS